MVILCHKCSGVLCANDRTESAALMKCGCISGYVRGFEPHLTRKEALSHQIDLVRKRVLLYEEKKNLWELQLATAQLERLEKLAVV